MAKTPSRDVSGRPAGRIARAGMLVRSARQERTIAGTRSATAPLEAMPQATATIPSESSRARIRTELRRAAGHIRRGGRVVVERRETAFARPAKRCATAAGPSSAERRHRRPPQRPSRSRSGAQREAPRQAPREEGAELRRRPGPSRIRRCSRPGVASRARASAGSTAMRMDWAARVITMKTPYAAKNPSVSSVRPELAGDDDCDDRREAGDDERRGRRQRSARQRAQAGRVCTLAHRRGSVRTMPNDTLWTGGTLDDLRSEFGDTTRVAPSS